MSAEERRWASLIQDEILGQASFPRSPFRKSDWCGLVFNRDKHGAAGLPKGVFDAAMASLQVGEGCERLLFVPAVFPAENAPTLRSVEISSWNDYLAVVGQIDFFPEYYLVTPSLSFLIWVDPDATIVGGAAGLMQDVMTRMGGRELAMKECAAEFGVDVNDAHSLIATFIRATGGA